MFLSPLLQSLHIIIKQSPFIILELRKLPLSNILDSPLTLLYPSPRLHIPRLLPDTSHQNPHAPQSLRTIATQHLMSLHPRQYLRRHGLRLAIPPHRFHRPLSWYSALMLFVLSGPFSYISRTIISSAS